MNVLDAVHCDQSSEEFGIAADNPSLSSCTSTNSTWLPPSLSEEVPEISIVTPEGEPVIVAPLDGDTMAICGG